MSSERRIADVRALSRSAMICVVLSAAWAQNAMCAESSPHELPGPWLRVFQQYVVGLYVDAQDYAPGQPVPLRAVRVELNRYNSGRRVSSYGYLGTYASGKRGPAGCLFDATEERLKVRLAEKAQTPCGKLLRRAADKLMTRFQQCDERAKADGMKDVTPHLFVRADLADTQCVFRPPYAVVEPSHQAEHIQRDILNWDAKAYLNLQTNRLFGCFGYGSSLEYRIEQLPDRRDYSIFGTDPFTRTYVVVWSKKYLIKTPGFSYCWGAKRIVDEPESLGGTDEPVFLNDGTALLPGNISVLRVRLKDGSTGAPVDRVKVFEPAVVHQWLDQHGGRECVGDSIAAGDCPLARAAGSPFSPHRKRPAGSTFEGDFYPFVILGADALIQKLF